MKKVGIVCPFILPVPAVKGGAIETLVTSLLDVNEIEKKVNFHVYSVYDEVVDSIEEKYQYTMFDYYKVKQSDNKNYKNSVRFLNRLNMRIPNRYFSYLIKKLKEDQVETVVVEANNVCAYYIAKALPHIKVLSHVHWDEFAQRFNYLHKSVQAVDNVIVVSDFLKNTAKKNGYQVNHFKVLKNATDSKIFDRNLYFNEKQSLKNKYNLTDEFVILYTGRITKDKGLRELLKSLLMIPQKYNFKLIIVGSRHFAEKTKLSDYEKEVQMLILKLGHKVINLGYIPNQELPKIHSITDLQIIPSQCEEAAGLVVIEAMQSGVPVIVSDSGGIHEYVCKDYSIEIKRGEHFCKELSQAIMYFYNNPEIAQKNAANCKKFSEQYTLESYYYNFLDVINS